MTGPALPLGATKMAPACQQPPVSSVSTAFGETPLLCPRCPGGGEAPRGWSGGGRCRCARRRGPTVIRCWAAGLARKQQPAVRPARAVILLSSRMDRSGVALSRRTSPGPREHYSGSVTRPLLLRRRGPVGERLLPSTRRAALWAGRRSHAPIASASESPRGCSGVTSVVELDAASPRRRRRRSRFGCSGSFARGVRDLR